MLTFPTDRGGTVPIAPLVVGALVERTPGVALFQVVRTAPATPRVRLRPEAGADAERVWQAVRSDLARLPAGHGLGHVALERAREAPEQSPGGKHREIVPFWRGTNPMTAKRTRQDGVPALSFDRLTPLYDALVRLVGFGVPFTERVLDAAVVRDGETLLDVGAGTGSLLLLAKRRHPHSRVIGLDPDDRILRRAREKLAHGGAGVELVRAGAEAIPLPDASVDVALSSLVFHHLPTAVKTAAIAEVHRVLRPGGRFLLADFGQPATPTWRVLFGLVRLLRVPEAATLQDNVDGKLPKFLAAAGFRVRAAAPRYRGIDFLLAAPWMELAEVERPEDGARARSQHAPSIGCLIVWRRMSVETRKSAVYMTRQGAFLRWPLDALMATMANGRIADLSRLRHDFRAVTEQSGYRRRGTFRTADAN